MNRRGAAHLKRFSSTRVLARSYRSWSFAFQVTRGSKYGRDALLQPARELGRTHDCWGFGTGEHHGP